MPGPVFALLLDDPLAAHLFHTVIDLPVVSLVFTRLYADKGRTGPANRTSRNTLGIIDGNINWLSESLSANPTIAAVAIFSFLGAWDEFTWALTAISDEELYTLPIAIRLFQQQHGTEWGLVFAASAIAVIPTITVFIIFQRHFIKGVTSGAIKG